MLNIISIKEMQMKTVRYYFTSTIVIQLPSLVQLCDPMNYSTPRFPVLHWLLEFAQVCSSSCKLVMPSNHLILCLPHLLLPSVFPSIRVFFSQSPLHIRWPKHWSSALATVLPMNIQG